MASWIYRRSYKEISLSLALSYNSVSFNYDHWCCCRVWFHKSKIIHRNIRKKNWMWELKMKAHIDGVFFLIFERQGRSLYQTPLLVSFHVLKGMSIGKTSKIYIVFWLDQPLIVYIYYSRNNMCLIQTWKNKQNLKKQISATALAQTWPSPTQIASSTDLCEDCWKSWNIPMFGFCSTLKWVGAH